MARTPLARALRGLFADHAAARARALSVGALRELRTAIDAFKLDADQNRIAGTCVKLGNENYPESLEFMVEGCIPPGRVDGVKRRWLRRIPLDPLTGSKEWGLRCYQDEADEDSWCGDNVYDVYTQSRATALDGSKYRDW